MDQIINSDYNSNTYFFLTGFSDIFCAGKNSFVINPTSNIVPGSEILVNVLDSLGNSLPVGQTVPQNAKYPEQTNTGNVYTCFVSNEVVPGIGKIQIKSVGINVGDYTGSIAYYQNNAYPVNSSTRLPLTQAPVAAPFPKVNVVWFKNVLIDITQPTKSEVRFFDFPTIDVRSEIYASPVYPYAAHRLASGSFSAIAVTPKNNLSGDFDYQFDTPIYQLYLKTGANFVSSMQGEKIRIKNPRIKSFSYSTLSNDQVVVENVTLNTDFLATIVKVVNEGSLLLSIPFSTVSELINLTNEDSIYSKNNLVALKGYNVNDDPLKQTMFHKKNFYALSIDNGEYEIFYKNIDTQLTAMSSGSKYLLNVSCDKLRLMCGNLATYRIYGKSLNSPETPTLLSEGRVEPDEHITTTNFNNGLYNCPGNFYSQTYVNKYWLKSGTFTFLQDSSTLIDGVKISHPSNADQTDYVIFKDDTTGGTRTAQYVDYTLGSNSYWYARSDAFLNYGIYPTSSYGGISNIPMLSDYAGSQENLLSGSVHDSNPIKLREKTMYQYSMRIRPASSNASGSALYIYFVSGTNKTEIGHVDIGYNSGGNELYTNTFFNNAAAFGTIMIVPVSGEWDISALSLKPYQNVDYSIDSFGVKVPYKSFLTNELVEIEMELYDSAGALAYGRNSYTFKYNKVFAPLKKQVFIDPAGTNEHGGGGGSIPDISSDTNFLYVKIFGKWYRTPIATSPQPGP
jgi:hypothetical protein